MGEFFDGVDRIEYRGPDSDNPLSFRWYDADRVVRGRTMAEHLRFAVCYWHSFAWDGSDIFGAGTLDRPWLRDGVTDHRGARDKMDAAFEFFEKLGGRSSASTIGTSRPKAPFAETCRNLDIMVDVAAEHMERTGVQLLWGTANLFSHPRYQAGAATNPDPEVFAYAAAQVAHCLDATQRLGGANYVLWGGREGYETLLNTDMARELDQLGRFLHMVVEHKHEIGFDGHDPDRAEAVRAHQAPVRLRRRDRVRVPPEVRPRRRGQGQHRGQPRHARRPRLRPRDRRRHRRGHLRDDRRQRRRRSTRLGRRPVPGVGRTDDARHVRAAPRRRLHHGRPELRREAPPPVERPRRSVPRPHRRHGHAGAGVARRCVDSRRRRTRPPS